MEEILASIRRIIADDQEGARAAPARPSVVPSPPPEPEDVLDLADLEPPLSTARLDFEREDLSFRDAEDEEDFDSIPVDDEPEAPPHAFEPEPPPPPPPPPKPAPREPETLLSSAAQATAAGAFQMLSTTVLSSNPRTLEDLVKEMLRPMLKTWLDENLPPLVERLVKAEIERLSRFGR